MNEKKTNWALVIAVALMVSGMLMLFFVWGDWQVEISVVMLAIAFGILAVMAARRKPGKPASSGKKNALKILGWGAAAWASTRYLAALIATTNQTEFFGHILVFVAALGGVGFVALIYLAIQAGRAKSERDAARAAEKAAFAAGGMFAKPEKSTIDAQNTEADKADNMGRNAGGAGPDVVE